MENLKIIIPAYALYPKEIEDTLVQLKELDLTTNSKPIVVVNDDPQNDMGKQLHKIVEIYENEGWVQGIHIKMQLGKAEALRRGWEKALEDKNIETILQIDGDLKQSLWDLPKLLQYMETQKADMVLANRYAHQNIEAEQPHRNAISGILSIAVNHVTGYELPDTVCGMRAYNRKLAELFSNKSKSFGYGIEIEQILLAATINAKIASFGVKSNRQNDFTNVDKIAENLEEFNRFFKELNVSEMSRNYFANYLCQIKARKDFIIDISGVGIPKRLSLKYNKENDSYSLENKYNQKNS